MEKVKSEENTIHSLYDKSGIQQSETSQILKITENYYSDLVRAGETKKEYQSDVLNKTKVRISQDQQRFCDKEIELTELEEGMKKLPIGKLPGLDGLPVKFYHKMWPNIKLDFLEMVKEVQNTNNLSDSQRKGVIRLIFKKEDRSDLKFYRPISLLNADVKIITKTLALRLGKVLPYIISNDQTCIVGRNIASKLHSLSDIVKYANSRNIEAAILFLDQAKAFDRVNHQFLIKTLKHLNFGDYFISWIEIILKDITSRVKINGFLTEEIEVTRGVRQGDPLSALLYVTMEEVRGNQIRSNRNISDATIRNIEQKILQYADDTQIIVSNNSSINEVFKQLRLYEEATGAKINISKTEGLFMGKWKNRHDKPFDCRWTNDKVFALGLWIGNKDTAEIVFTEQLAKIKSKRSYWKPRKLSLIVQVRVTNIFVLSRLWYRTEFFSIPPHILRELESYIIEFVWNRKKTRSQ